MEHAIVGFELLGDPVLGGEFIAFKEGLNVFYGLNGTGKTRALTGIRNSLLGIASDIRLGLVVRIHAPTTSDVEADGSLSQLWGHKQRASGAGLLLALADGIGGRYEKEVRSRGSGELEYSLQAAFQVVMEHLRDELEPFIEDDPVEIPTEELRTALLTDPLFILVPDGTSANPRWQAWPVADRTLPVIQRWRSVGPTFSISIPTEKRRRS